MTTRFTLTLATEGGAASSGGAVTRAITATVQRDALAPETLGLTLAEGKAILAELQEAVVAEQVAAHEQAVRPCPACGTDRGVKDRRPIICRTAFGTLPIRAARLRRCGAAPIPLRADAPRSARSRTSCPSAPRRSCFTWRRAGRLWSPSAWPRPCWATCCRWPARLPTSRCDGTCTRWPRTRRPRWARSRTGRPGPGRVASATWTRCPRRTGRPTSASVAATCGTALGPGSKWSRANACPASAGTPRRTSHRARPSALPSSKPTTTGRNGACWTSSSRKGTPRTSAWW